MGSIVHPARATYQTHTRPVKPVPDSSRTSPPVYLSSCLVPVFLSFHFIIAKFFRDPLVVYLIGRILHAKPCHPSSSQWVCVTRMRLNSSDSQWTVRRPRDLLLATDRHNRWFFHVDTNSTRAQGVRCPLAWESMCSKEI